MRRNIGLLILLVTLGWAVRLRAETNESSAYEGNRIDTLHYRAPQGVFNLNVNFNTFLHYDELMVQSGQNTIDYKRTSYSMGATLGYGITDKFSISLADTFNFSETLTTNNILASTTTSQSSTYPNDPTLTLNYRYVGGLEGKLFANAFADFTPNLGDTALSAGQNIVDLGSNIRYVLGDHEFSLIGTALYYFSRTYNAANPANNYNQDGYFAVQLEGLYRVHVFHDYYAQAFATFATSHSVNTTYPSQSTVYSTPVRLVPGVELGWRPWESAALFVRYAYQGYTESGVPSASASFTNGYNISTLYVGANIQL